MPPTPRTSETMPPSISQMALSVGFPVKKREKSEPTDSDAEIPNARRMMPTMNNAIPRNRVMGGLLMSGGYNPSTHDPMDPDLDDAAGRPARLAQSEQFHGPPPSGSIRHRPGRYSPPVTPGIPPGSPSSTDTGRSSMSGPRKPAPHLPPTPEAPPQDPRPVEPKPGGPYPEADPGNE